MGGTVDPLYEAHNFVEENPDVIVASIEYRVGVFGFFPLFHLPDGQDYPDTQNLGLMDQMMALKWIHENIEAFGGDPDNVTIWGIFRCRKCDAAEMRTCGRVSNAIQESRRRDEEL